MNDLTKILLIEDNPGDARLIRELLAEEKGSSFRLECTDRLSAGIERLTNGKVDVILLDLGLPDSQGFDTFIKVHNSVPQIPIVILSGLTDEALAARMVREGAQDYLVKGHVDNNLLGRSLRYAIKRKQADEALQASEEKWRSLAQNAPNIIMIVNPDGTIQFVNRPLPGINAKEASKRTIYDYTLPKYRKIAKETIKNVLQTGKASNYEARGVGPDGQISWYDTQAGPIKHDGQVVAVALITTDITERKRAQEQLEDSLIDLVETVSRAIETRDPYTSGHQRRVAELARITGEKLGLAGDKINALYIGGLLHDLGKICLPESILSKPGKLTEEEWSLICTHPKRGYDILKDTKLPWPIAETALHHHERLDGSGYPHGISGDELSLEIRILAVCDVVEAMASFRPYRPARSKQEVMEEIQGGRGTKYDAEVVDVVLQILENGEFDFGWEAQGRAATKVTAIA